MTERKRRSSAPAGRSAALAERGLTAARRRVLLWAGGTVAIVAAAVLLTLLVNAVLGGAGGPVGPEGVLGQNRPDAYQAWPSLKEFAPIEDRTADGRPLTAQEVFGSRTLSAGKITLRRVGSRVESGCAGVVWGAELTEALEDAGCTQAARGLYRTQDGRYVAQYTLFNLRDVQAANEFVEALTTLHHGGWVLPLDPGKTAFGGYSEASGYAMGHYAGLVWIGRADGAEPGQHDDFVMLGLAVRGAEKALFRRVVAVAGLPSVKPDPGSGDAQPSEAPPDEPGAAVSPSASAASSGSPGAEGNR